MEIECNHPEFGKVIFTEPTSRQEEVLQIYNKTVEGANKYPNNQKFGEYVRFIVKNAPHYEKKI